jgi:hypothetical protein
VLVPTPEVEKPPARGAFNDEVKIRMVTPGGSLTWCGFEIEEKAVA